MHVWLRATLRVVTSLKLCLEHLIIDYGYIQHQSVLYMYLHACCSDDALLLTFHSHGKLVGQLYMRESFVLMQIGPGVEIILNETVALIIRMYML